MCRGAECPNDVIVSDSMTIAGERPYFTRLFQRRNSMVDPWYNCHLRIQAAEEDPDCNLMIWPRTLITRGSVDKDVATTTPCIRRTTRSTIRLVPEPWSHSLGVVGLWEKYTARSGQMFVTKTHSGRFAVGWSTQYSSNDMYFSTVFRCDEYSIFEYCSTNLDLVCDRD
jgi:hypothetical protein